MKIENDACWNNEYRKEIARVTSPSNPAYVGFVAAGILPAVEGRILPPGQLVRSFFAAFATLARPFPSRAERSRCSLIFHFGFLTKRSKTKQKRTFLRNGLAGLAPKIRKFAVLHSCSSLLEFWLGDFFHPKPPGKGNKKVTFR
jgi:hypothetical protein